MLRYTEVAIIGAGPYGLSLAAHLKSFGKHVTVFGSPMGTWRRHMPPGMCLKSDGFASSLSDPKRVFPLREFCRLKGISYAERGLPVHLETFLSYGLAFQRRFVADLDERMVLDVIQDDAGFQLTLHDGECVRARFVVVAAGISHFGTVPEILATLPPGLVSHSSKCDALERLKDRDVVVLGAGASAVDMALSLYDVGARPQLVTRRDAVPFHLKAAENRSMFTRIKNPWSGLGPGWRSRLACDFPTLFHILPRKYRLRAVKSHLGPAPGWFTRERLLRHVPMQVGLTLVDAEVEGGKLRLGFRDPQNVRREIYTDHVVAGTGYKVDIARLKFLASEIRDGIATEEKCPILSRNFEASVPGLYFIGACAAYSFGPLLRFAFGADFAARRLSRHLARRLKKESYSVLQASQSSNANLAAEQV